MKDANEGSFLVPIMYTIKTLAFELSLIDINMSVCSRTHHYAKFVFYGHKII